MKLLFGITAPSWYDSFDVSDEIGNRLFRIEAKKEGAGKRLKVYAAYLHNKSVATLKESRDEAPAVEIKHGTRFVSVVRRLRARGFFDLGFIDWYAAGDFEKGAFRLYDANDRMIADVATMSAVQGKICVVDTLPEYTLHALTFTLAVCVQLTEQTEQTAQTARIDNLPAPAEQDREETVDETLAAAL